MRKFTATGLLALGALVSALSFGEQAAQWATVNGHRVHPDRLMVKLKHDDPVSRARVDRLLQQKGLAVRYRYLLVSGLCLLSAPSVQGLAPGQQRQRALAQRERALGEWVRELQQSGLFDYVEPDYVGRAFLVPSDRNFHDGRLWGLNNTGSPEIDIEPEQAWDITTGSPDVIVGVLDTGVLYTHNELTDQMWTNPGEIPDDGIDNDGNGFVDDVFGMNAVSDSGNPLDDEGHGTHVAGTIAAAANGGGPVVGVAWDVRIMGLKVLDSGGFGSGSDLIQAFEYGVDHGCRVINASLGGYGYSQALFDAIAEAKQRGVLFVAAAGNSALNTDNFPSYPANYNLDNVISVAAMDRYGQLADFSNFGSKTVHIAAPGVNILSLGIGDDDDYTENSGTSMACPHVAGVAALVFSAFPGSAPEDVRTRITKSAIPMDALFGRVTSNGRLSAIGALGVTGDGALEMTVNPPSSSVIQIGSKVTVVVRVSDVFGVPNAVVTGALPDGNTVAFSNDGEVPDVLAGDALYTAELTMPDAPGEYVFSVRAEAPEKEWIMAEVRYVVVSPPVNDDFASSTKLPAEGTKEPLKEDTRFATIEYLEMDGVEEEDRVRIEPLHAGLQDSDHSLWWTWTAPEDGEVFIDTSGSSYNTVIAVYTGNALEKLEPVASVDDVGTNPQGYLDFEAVRGVSYRIAAAGADEEESGTLRFRLTPNGLLDSTAPVVVINTPKSGTLTTKKRIELRGFAYDPRPNASGVESVFVRVNNEIIPRTATGTSEWTTSVPLQPGRNVIAVTAADFSRNVSDAKMLEVRYDAPEPPNDHFVNAELLEGTAGEVRADIRSATWQFEEPYHAGSGPGASVWYAYTPSKDGILNLAIQRADFDTLLAVYTGERVSALQQVAFNDDAEVGQRKSAITQAVLAGVRYSIAVSGLSGEIGVADLSYAFTPKAVFTVTVESGAEGSITPESGVFGAGAKLTFLAKPNVHFRFVAWEGDVTSVNAARNPLTFVVDRNMRLKAVFESSVSDSFETGDFVSVHSAKYHFGGNQPWTVAAWDREGDEPPAFVGNFSARAGEIGGNENSSLILRAELAGGPASFDYRVSSEEGWDVFAFYLNGNLVQKWSGEIPWQSFEFDISPGNAELEWRYTKDASGTSGDDTVYIDNLNLPFTPPIVPRLSAVSIPEGIQLRIEGEAGRMYRIESSENLIDWAPFVVEAASQEVIIRFADPKLAGARQHFFRAVVVR